MEVGIDESIVMLK